MKIKNICSFLKIILFLCVMNCCVAFTTNEPETEPSDSACDILKGKLGAYYEKSREMSLKGLSRRRDTPASKVTVGTYEGLEEICPSLRTVTTVQPGQEDASTIWFTFDYATTESEAPPTTPITLSAGGLDNIVDGIFPFPIWDQRNTSAGWAFASADAVAIQGFINTDKRRRCRLSPQYLREMCHADPKDDGTIPVGNTINKIIKCLEDPGVALESDYPTVIGRKIPGTLPPRYGFKAIKVAVFQGRDYLDKCLERGVIMAAIRMDATFKYPLYNGYVIEKGCYGDKNHYVLITGKKMIDGKWAWIARNSYGEAFGDNGLMYLSAEASNPLCMYEELTVLSTKFILGENCPDF